MNLFTAFTSIEEVRLDVIQDREQGAAGPVLYGLPGGTSETLGGTCRSSRLYLNALPSYAFIPLSLWKHVQSRSGDKKRMVRYKLLELVSKRV